MKKNLILLLISVLLLCVFTACKKEEKKESGNSDTDITSDVTDDVVNDGDDSNDSNESNNNDSYDDYNPSDTNNTPSDTDNGDCEHTYSDYWSSNSNEHWHKATCEHSSLKYGVAGHTDTDEDGLCDVCEYEVGHTHTFDSEWTYDTTHHWHVSTCSHETAKSELGAHKDSNSDGACDFCAIHMHVVSAFGLCTICGDKLFDVDVIDISEVIELAVASAARVTGGRVEYENICTEVRLNPETADPTDIMRIISSQERDILYTLGNGAAYYKVISTATYDENVRTGMQESWYERTSDNSVFGVYSTDSVTLTPDAASELNLIGYSFVVSTLANARGAENLLHTLYRLSQDDYASDYLCDEIDGGYTFSFNYLKLNTGTAEGVRADYYELKVSFCVSDNGVLTQLDVKCDCYTNSLHYEDETEYDLNNDYVFDQATQKITMKDTAIPDTYTFSITQYEGVRTYVSEHPESEFVPSDFDIYLDTELSQVASDTVEVVVGKSTRVYLGNFTPVGSSVSYLKDSFTASCETSDVYCSVNTISSSVMIYAKKEGTYTLRIFAGDVVKEITVVAKANTPSWQQPTENSVEVYITDNNAWVDLAVFTAEVDGDYTFTIAPGVYLGAMEKGSAPWADYNRTDENGVPRGGSITVSLKAGETYKFYVMSQEKYIKVYIPYTISAYSGS